MEELLTLEELEALSILKLASIRLKLGIKIEENLSDSFSLGKFELPKLTYDAQKLFDRIKEFGYLEYRDSEYKDMHEFTLSEHFDRLGSKYFYDRNEGGTLYLCKELENLGLIEQNDNSWHTTFVLTNYGKTL